MEKKWMLAGKGPGQGEEMIFMAFAGDSLVMVDTTPLFLSLSTWDSAPFRRESM